MTCTRDSASMASAATTMTAWLARTESTAGVVGPGEHGDRVVLGCHRNPLVGLSEHRRLAGDRVAKDGEAVRRTDREGVEAVEILEAAFECLLERRSFPKAPGEVAGSDLRVVLGLKLDPLAPKGAAQSVVIRERAVVHETEV